MTKMMFSTGAVVAAAGVAYTYLSKLTFFTGAKYYVSQQLAQMQMHYYNKDRIKRAAKTSGDDRLPKVVEKIFEAYEKDIKYDKWCWIKYKDGDKIKWMCVEKKDNICKNQKFGGIFPPIATLEQTVEPCTDPPDASNWEINWKNIFVGYGKGYLSDLEYNVLQLEALEQDLALKL